MARIITFLLPSAGIYPVGGYKVVNEYANKFAADNYQVNIIYSATISIRELSVLQRIRGVGSFFYRHIMGYNCKKWFKLHPNVKESLVFSLKQQNIPESDVYIATSWITAEYLAAFQNTSKKKLFYLIQHYEDWGNIDEGRLIKTWKAPLHKIVIAPWLQAIANKLGEEATLIENGFDFDFFKLTIPINERDPYCICMLYHPIKWKGYSDGLKAIEIVKEHFSQLRVNLFGMTKMNSILPDWIRYFQLPNREIHNRIYNEAAIYVGPSHKEGFGLTIGEAMQCGCAVACTNNGGYMVMAQHEKTALISNIGEVEMLSQNIIRLIEDYNLRIRIAEEGNKMIQKFTWDRAYDKFKKLIEG